MRLLKPLVLAVLGLFTSIGLAQIPAPQINLSGTTGVQGSPFLNNGTLQFSSDANHTMTAPESSATGGIKVTSTVSLTATRSIVIPSIFGNLQFLAIENSTTGGQSISICSGTGTTCGGGLAVTIPNGQTFAGVWFDGTNVVAPNPGSGGLTSFTSGNLGPLFTTSLGSNPTTAPALAFTASTAAQNFVLAGPATGGTGAYSFRALTANDIPTLNQNTTGTAANVTATSNSTLTTLSALSLPGSQVTGTVSAATTSGNITATTNSTLTTLSALSLLGSQVTGTVPAASTAPASGLTGTALPNAIVTANGLSLFNNVVVEVASPSNPSSTGTAIPYLSTSDTIKTIANDGTISTTIVPCTSVSNSWISALGSNGVCSFSQPSSLNLSDYVTNWAGVSPYAQLLPASNYYNASNTPAGRYWLVTDCFSSACTAGGGTGIAGILQANSGGTWTTVMALNYSTGTGGVTYPTGVLYGNNSTSAPTVATSPQLVSALNTSPSTTLATALIPTLNQNTTGTASNITATSNSTLTTLSALSLPYTQVNGLGTAATANTTAFDAAGAAAAVPTTIQACGYAVDTGSANAYAVSLPACSGYTGGTAGYSFYAKITNSSTGSSTIAINGGATKTLACGFCSGGGTTSGYLNTNGVYAFFDTGTTVTFTPVDAPVVFLDNNLTIGHNTTNTAVMKFSASLIPASTTITLTAPNANTTIAGLAVAETFTQPQTAPQWITTAGGVTITAGTGAGSSAPTVTGDSGNTPAAGGFTLTTNSGATAGGTFVTIAATLTSAWGNCVLTPRNQASLAAFQSPGFILSSSTTTASTWATGSGIALTSGTALSYGYTCNR